MKVGVFSWMDCWRYCLILQLGICLFILTSYAVTGCMTTLVSDKVHLFTGWRDIPVGYTRVSKLRDSATFRDKETEVPSLSRDKGTMQWDKLKILPWNGTRDGTITILLSKSGTGQSLFLSSPIACVACK